DLLARGHDDVDLAVVRILVDLLREREQAVGLAGHRRDDDGDVVALALRLQTALGDALHARDGAHGRAAVLLHDEHAETLLCGDNVCYSSRPCRPRSWWRCRRHRRRRRPPRSPTPSSSTGWPRA